MSSNQYYSHLLKEINYHSKIVSIKHKAWNDMTIRSSAPPPPFCCIYSVLIMNEARRLQTQFWEVQGRDLRSQLKTSSFSSLFSGFGCCIESLSRWLKGATYRIDFWAKLFSKRGKISQKKTCRLSSGIDRSLSRLRNIPYYAFLAMLITLDTPLGQEFSVVLSFWKSNVQEQHVPLDKM